MQEPVSLVFDCCNYIGVTVTGIADADSANSIEPFVSCAVIETDLPPERFPNPGVLVKSGPDDGRRVL
jgi:hypothetical protein